MPDVMTDLPADLGRLPAPDPRSLDTLDFADCRGTAIAGVVDQIAEAVRANARVILLAGPTGVGKTMLARRIPTILPALEDHEARWLAAEYEGVLRERPRITERPFRAPHYTISAAAMVGSGVVSETAYEYSDKFKMHIPSKPIRKHQITRAGELDLARFGVLFLDELAEFPKSVIEALAYRLRRMTGAPRLIASAQRCPCGWAGVGASDGRWAAAPSPMRACTCTPGAVDRYWWRVAGHLELLTRPRDRGESVIHVAIEVPPVALADLRSATGARSSAEIRAALWGAS